MVVISERGFWDGETLTDGGDLVLELYGSGGSLGRYDGEVGSLV